MDHFYEPNLVTLAPGTQTQWQVRGGSNFWKDYSDTYTTELQIESGDGASML